MPSISTTTFLPTGMRFGASWAWPKPVQPRIPVLAGAGGTERTFRWIAACADGWLTTPGETDLDGKVALLHKIWQEAGRTRTCWRTGPRSG